MKPLTLNTRLKVALQLLSTRHGHIHFAQVPERVSTTSIVVLSMGNSRVESRRRTGHLLGLGVRSKG